MSERSKGSGCLGAVLWFVAVGAVRHLTGEVLGWSPWPSQALAIGALLVVTVLVLAIGRQARDEVQADPEGRTFSAQAADAFRKGREEARAEREEAGREDEEARLKRGEIVVRGGWGDPKPTKGRRG
jgi:hypothetical protein